jgi:hypothetical protein
LIGGTGGACIWLWRLGVDAVEFRVFRRLPDLEREPLLDRVPSSGRSTVGTRDVDDTNVGSEMSFFRTTRFMLSSSRTAPLFESCPDTAVIEGEGIGGAEGRRGD